MSWRSLVTGAQSKNQANTENIKTDGTSNPTSSGETTDSENPHNEECKKLSLQLEEVQVNTTIQYVSIWLDRFFDYYF